MISIKYIHVVKKKYLTGMYKCCIIIKENVVKGKSFTGGDYLEKIVRQSLLYDFYGELLTEHQKSIYEDVVMNDLSYTEIAKINGISRQGVYDMIKRCDKILEEYEDKLRLVEKFENAREKMAHIKESIKLLREKNEDGQLELLISDIGNEVSLLIEEF